MFYILSCSLHANTIYVSPQGGSVVHNGKSITSLAPQQALDQANAGSTIVFLPAIYSGHYHLKNSGRSEAPIIITGVERKSILQGKNKPEVNASPCFLLSSVEWVEITDFTIRNYWPRAILAKNCRYITFKKSYIEGCKRVFSAIGGESHHFLVEDNEWNQDPTGDLWTKLSWAELHHGKYKHFNGALFASKNILGGIVFRRNYIKNAYNGIRPTAKKSEKGKANVNVEVYDNIFERIRDNPIEPEQLATNWWVHHNVIHNAHAWFSITNVAGSRIYIFSNVGWDDEQYGIPGDHTKGRVFKFQNLGPFPDDIHIFHNSWHIRRPLLDHDYTTHLRHWNNAIQFQSDTFTFLGSTKWQQGYFFDYDLSNFPFDQELQNNKEEQYGVVGEAKFLNPKAGDFRLGEDSPAIDKGMIFSIDKWTPIYQGKAPDIGAFEGKQRFVGPIFHCWGNVYPERPRIVSLITQQNKIIITFSVPLKTITEKTITIITSSKKSISSIKYINNNHSIVASFKDPLVDVEHIEIPRDFCGKDNLPVSLWASTDNRVKLR